MVLFHPNFKSIATILILTSIFPLLDGAVPCLASYGVTGISQRFTRVCSHVSVFNARNDNLQPNFSSRANGVINVERLFPNFISDTMNWFQNLLSG